jgi:hypothetical protein
VTWILANFPKWPSVAGQAGSEAGGWHTYILGVLGIPWACGLLLKEEQRRYKGTKERDFVVVLGWKGLP